MVALIAIIYIRFHFYRLNSFTMGRIYTYLGRFVLLLPEFLYCGVNLYCLDKFVLMWDEFILLKFI